MKQQPRTSENTPIALIVLGVISNGKAGDSKINLLYLLRTNPRTDFWFKFSVGKRVRVSLNFFESRSATQLFRRLVCGVQQGSVRLAEEVSGKISEARVYYDRHYLMSGSKLSCYLKRCKSICS